MRVELLYFDGCPHAGVAEERLNDALRLAGRRDVRVERILVDTSEQADGIGFIGSATIRIDGRDPFSQGIEHVGLACRVYTTPDGLRRAATVEQIAMVLT